MHQQLIMGGANVAVNPKIQLNPNIQKNKERHEIRRSEKRLENLLSLVGKCNENALKSLVQNGKLSFSETDVKGKNILILASKRGQYETADKVISVITDLMNRAGILLFFNHQDEVGRTALYFAVKGRHFDIACLLIKAGANPDICDGRGDSPRTILEKFRKDGVSIVRTSYLLELIN